jgi:hypothetical protein
MTQESWSYPPELMEVLLGFGLKPAPTTPPLMVRGALNDLYRFEIRRLRDRMVAGKFDKARYSDAVVGLRKKYWPLSLQPAHWELICAGETPRG